MTTGPEIPEDIDAIASAIVRADYSNEVEPDYALYLAIAQALLAERNRDRWELIETAPKDQDFIGYGFYLYPGDDDRTEYICIAERTESSDWPFRSDEGFHCPGFFSHWQALPSPPKGDDT